MEGLVALALEGGKSRGLIGSAGCEQGCDPRGIEQPQAAESRAYERRI